MSKEAEGAPPAASAVVTDPEPPTAAELVKARRELQEKDKTLKDRETRISQLEDENHRLKGAAKPSPGTATPEPRACGIDSWLWD